MNKAIKLTVLAVSLSTMTACSGMGSIMGKGNDFYMAGTAEGIDAYYQGHMGVIEGAKQAEGSALYAQETYRQKEGQRTYREAFKMGANPFAKAAAPRQGGN